MSQRDHRSAKARLEIDRPVPYNWYLWLPVCAWTAIVAGSLAWNLAKHEDEMKSLAFQVARALLEKDLLYREWSILHGGVYVPRSGEAERAPFAKDEEREIVTPSGRTLTLLNPAVVSRQIFELQNQTMGIRGHITSLKPHLPANSPDEWERQALGEFEKGLPEAVSIENQQGELYFRMMRPLVTTPSCLRCHEEQGRKVGEIRGGISVTVPMSRFVGRSQGLRLALAHTSLWLVGMTGLILGTRDLRQHLQARQRAEAERERLIAELREALANVRTLSGLIPICASCKNIRDDQGYWTHLESYLRQHSQAEFSHGICPDCTNRLYPGLLVESEGKKTQPEPSPESC